MLGVSGAEDEIQVHMKKYADCLKVQYLAGPELPEADHPPSLKGGDYIRLALIQHERSTHTSRYGPVVEMQKDYTRGNFDKILKRKTEIDFEQLFMPRCSAGNLLASKVLIDGAPGVGKTTLCRKACREWAKNNLLKDYHLVVLLHLRDREISKAKSIEAFFSHDDEDLQKLVVKHIKQTEGEHVAIIFDGFDELSYKERTRDSLILKIIKREDLCRCSVFVTSRPYASGTLQEMSSVKQHVEVLGFTDDQVRHCIMKSVSNQDKARELCTQLQERLDIISLCHIPLNCRIVLFVYQQEDYQLPKTLTELYELFVVHTLKRHTKRLDGEKASRKLNDLNHIPAVTRNKVNFLCKMAFEGLTSDKLIFPEDTLDAQLCVSNDSDVEPYLLDLMNAAKSFHKTGSKITYSFLHLTIQEFLAAKWFVEHSSPLKQLEFLGGNLGNDRFRMTLLFMAGLLKHRFSSLSPAFKCFDISRYQQSHVGAPVHENSALYRDFLWMCHMIYESESQDAAKSLSQLLNRRQLLNFQVSEYSTFECLVFASFIASSNSEWDVLELTSCTIGRLRVFYNVFANYKLRFSIQNVKLELNDKQNVDPDAPFIVYTEYFQSIIDFSELLPVQHVELSLDMWQNTDLGLLISQSKKITLNAVKWEVRGHPNSVFLNRVLEMIKNVRHLYINLKCQASQTIYDNLLTSIFKSLAETSLLETLLVDHVSPYAILGSLQQAIKLNVILRLRNISLVLDSIPPEVELLFDVAAHFLSTSTITDFTLSFGNIHPGPNVPKSPPLDFLERLADTTSVKKVKLIFPERSFVFERNEGSLRCISDDQDRVLAQIVAESAISLSQYSHSDPCFPPSTPNATNSLIVPKHSIYGTEVSDESCRPAHNMLSPCTHFSSSKWQVPYQPLAQMPSLRNSSTIHCQPTIVTDPVSTRLPEAPQFMPRADDANFGYGTHPSLQHEGVAGHCAVHSRKIYSQANTTPVAHFHQHPSLLINPNFGTTAPHLDYPPLQHTAKTINNMSRSLNTQQNRMLSNTREHGPLASQSLHEPTRVYDQAVIPSYGSHPSLQQQEVLGHYGVQSSHTSSNIPFHANGRPSPMRQFQQYPPPSYFGTEEPPLDYPRLQLRAMSIHDVTSSRNSRIPLNSNEYGPLASQSMPEQSPPCARTCDFNPNYVPKQQDYRPRVQSSYTPFNTPECNPDQIEPTQVTPFQHDSSLPDFQAAAPHHHSAYPRLQHGALSIHDVTSSRNSRIPPNSHEYGPLASQSMPEQSLHCARTCDFDPDYVPKQQDYRPRVHSSRTPFNTPECSPDRIEPTQVTPFQHNPSLPDFQAAVPHHHSAYPRLQHGAMSGYNVTPFIDTQSSRISHNPFHPLHSQQSPADTYPHPNSQSHTQ